MTTSSSIPFGSMSQLLHGLAHHPNPDVFRTVVVGSSRLDREGIVRLWLTEGIPFAFRDCAGVYEELRVWLASRTKVQPKDVTLVGSARIGFSMGREFGRVFGMQSDLDLAIVNAELFAGCSNDAEQFLRLLKNNEITPNANESFLSWKKAAETLRWQLPRGFVDTWQVPNRRVMFKAVYSVNDAAWRVKAPLEETGLLPPIKRASIRVYRDWEALTAQVSLNLDTLKKALIAEGLSS